MFCFCLCGKLLADSTVKSHWFEFCNNLVPENKVLFG